MSKLEHANLDVSSFAATAQFLPTAFPEFTILGRSKDKLPLRRLG